MFDNDGTFVSNIALRMGTSPPPQPREDVESGRAGEAIRAEGRGFIAVIENRGFLRESMQRGLQSALSLPVVAFSTVSDLERQHTIVSPQLVFLSLVADGNEEVGLVNICCNCFPKCQ